MSLLLFADVTSLVTGSVEKFSRLVSEFGGVCDRSKLRVNAGKIRVMRRSSNDDASGFSVREIAEVL